MLFRSRRLERDFQRVQCVWDEIVRRSSGSPVPVGQLGSWSALSVDENIRGHSLRRTTWCYSFDCHSTAKKNDRSSARSIGGNAYFDSKLRFMNSPKRVERHGTQLCD